jgi:RNA-directed DNA polymerase
MGVRVTERLKEARVQTCEPTGGMRKLGIPSVLNRVVMQSIASVLGYLFEPTFSDNSIGYRPHCSVQQAAGVPSLT